MLQVRVQHDDFDQAAELAAVALAGAGAVASFTGLVRSDPARPLKSLTLEHYPGMTEAALAKIAGAAMDRYGLLGCSIIHRIGALAPGAQIVFVATSAAHRRAALDATSALIDWLKTHAPFWKQECFVDGTSSWVAPAPGDVAAPLAGLGDDIL